MANYFVVNSKFKPYSFDEMLKPYALYGQAYKEQEDALSQLESNAAALESALSETNDPVAYNTYKNYLNNVRSAADDIATNGINSESRRRAKSLLSEYNSNVVPIQAAYNRRKELQDEQRKALLSNPTLYYQRNFNEIGPESSIDRFVENPNYDYGNFFSGALLEKQVADAADVLAKELTAYGKGKPLDKYTNTFIQQHGFTRDQVLNAIHNPDSPESSPVLNALVNSVIESSGVSGWNDENALNAANSYARRGLYHAVGQTNISTFDNYGAKLAAQEAMHRRVNSNPFSVSGVSINPLNLFSQKERTKASDNISKYKDYFNVVNGKYQLTEKGKRAYEGWKAPTSGVGEQYKKAYNIPDKLDMTSEFRTFIDNIQNEGESPEQAWSRYLSEHESDIYDARRSTEYDYTYDPTQQDSMKQVIMTAARGVNLEEVDYDSASNTFKPTGKTLSLDKFTSPDYQVVASRMSSAGTQMMIQNKKTGETTRYRMPMGINVSAETSRDNAFKAADQYRELFASAETPQEQALAYQKYLEAIQSAYLYQSQIGLTSKTKPQEYNPYMW